MQRGDEPIKENLYPKGELKGHNGWVTCLKTLHGIDKSEHHLLSGSRDKSLMLWKVYYDSATDKKTGEPQRALTGHNHFIQDVTVSHDHRYAISASWDRTLRLWDLEEGKTVRHFVGHESDVLSVDFSPDNRQIVSSGRDKSIKLWNTLAECKLSMEKDVKANDSSEIRKEIPQMHNDWVSCVRFSPISENNPRLIVSAGWDHAVKLWNQQNLQLQCDLVGHTNFVNTLAISPDAYICASGGKDGKIMVWALNGKYLNSLDSGDCINALVFNPERYWIVAGTDKGIKVWDLKSKRILCEYQPQITVNEKKN